MLASKLIFLALALLGHAAFWVGLVNRGHSFGLPRPVVKSTVLLFYAALFAIPLAVVARWCVSTGLAPTWELNGEKAYLVFAAAYGAVHLPIWAAERVRSLRLPESVRLEHRYVVDVEQQLGFSPARGLRASLFMHVPFNQLWHVEVSEFSIALPRLAPALDALSICHWSDLHLSGRIDRAYFEEIVRLTNAMQVDLIALTGDVCDRANLIDWIPELLGPARARLGKYFILGNHDLRTRDVCRLRGAMQEAGFTDLCDRLDIVEVAGSTILLGGDERPWFRGTPPIPETSDSSASETLKILLAHTPDRLRWAREQRFDLMLSGHTHGGQIRFPLIGPMVCPSWHGTKYSAGFFSEPPTLLHVNRGTASLFPLRINCRPELSKLVLRVGDANIRRSTFDSRSVRDRNWPEADGINEHFGLGRNRDVGE